MASVESDDTYCSEAEKENSGQLRRSLRLSQKPRQCFRLDGDSASRRFEEIHRLLKEGTICQGWSLYDWESLRVEFEGLRRRLAKKVAKSKIAFIVELIKRRMGQLNPTTDYYFRQQVIEAQKKRTLTSRSEVPKSPNILDTLGLVTETFIDIPPYQPVLNVNPGPVEQKPTAKTPFTQANPMDLSKRAALQSEAIQKEILSKPAESTSTPKKISANTILNNPPNWIVDLTKDTKADEQITMPSPIIGPNQERTITSDGNTVNDESKESYIPVVDSKPRQFFKDSIIQLYKDHVSVSANEVPKHSKTDQPKSPRKKKKKKTRSKDYGKPTPFRNTEAFIRGPPEPVEQPPPRNAQSEFVSHISPNSFNEDLISLDLTSIDGSNSPASLTASLKTAFKKVYGTDCLNDVLGCEKIAYSLSEGHVKRLAKVLDLKYDSLKKAIEQVLSEDQSLVVIEGDDKNSNSSVVECSQSPPLRLFPSQRSQTLQSNK